MFDRQNSFSVWFMVASRAGLDFTNKADSGHAGMTEESRLHPSLTKIIGSILFKSRCDVMW